MSTGGATSVSSHEVADFSQELFSGWSWGVFVNAEALVVHLVELIDWCNDDEVDHCRDDQEVDNGGDDNTEVNEGVFIVGDLETKTSHIGSKIEVEVTSAAGAKSNRNFKIVGSNEADPRGGKISDESAVGKALIGARVGQTVEVETPVGVSVYHILSISR